jgi:hypothetical protein
VTVTGALVSSIPPSTAPSPGAQLPQSIEMTPNGAEACTHGTCVSMTGKPRNYLDSTYSRISASKVAEATRLRGVAAAGGITLPHTSFAFPASGSLPQSGGYTIDGNTDEVTPMDRLPAAAAPWGKPA